MMKKIKLFGTLLLFGVMIPALGQSLTSHYFESGHVRLHYMTAGTGEPVILIHGVTDNIPVCFQQPLPPTGTDFMTKLAEKYQVVAIDTRGHGQSDKPTGVESYGKVMEEDIIRLMDHLKIEKAHLVGYSMGAFIIGNLLVNHKDRVKSAALVGGTPLTKQQFYEAHPLYQVFVKTAQYLANESGINPLLEWYWSTRQPVPTKEILDSLSQQILEGQSNEALQDCLIGFKALFQVDEKKLGQNNIPVALIIGDDDPMIDFIAPFQQLPSSSLVVIPKANHLDILMYPECLTAVEQFLQETQGLSGRATPAEH